MHQPLRDDMRVPDDAATVARVANQHLLPVTDVDLGRRPGARWAGGRFGEVQDLGAFVRREEVGDQRREVLAVFWEAGGGEVDGGRGAGWWGRGAEEVSLGGW